MRWGTGIETACLTLSSTHQEYTRTTDSLTRRLKTSRANFRYPILEGPYAQFHTDVLLSKIVSLRGNTCGQVYYNRARFYKFYPLKSKKDVHITLLPLIELVGIPSGTHSDRAPELISGRFGTLLQTYRICRTTTESDSPWQNRAEGEGLNPSGIWLL